MLDVGVSFLDGLNLNGSNLFQSVLESGDQKLLESCLLKFGLNFIPWFEEYTFLMHKNPDRRNLIISTSCPIKLKFKEKA